MTFGQHYAWARGFVVSLLWRKGLSEAIYSELESLKGKFKNIDAYEWSKVAGNGYINDMGLEEESASSLISDR